MEKEHKAFGHEFTNVTQSVIRCEKN